jgi:hypothetical protein
MGEIWFYDASALTYIKPSAFTVDAAGRLTGSIVRADGATAVVVATGDLLVQVSNADGVTGTTTTPGSVVHTTLVSKA